MNAADLIARAFLLNEQNNIEQRLRNIRQIAVATFLTNIAQRLSREETNQQFWFRIFSNVMRNVVHLEADNRSESLHGNTIIYKRNLTADFMCPNPNCFKRWDSTQVNVEFHYEAHRSSNGIQGTITLYEINKQHCEGCIEGVCERGSVMSAKAGYPPETIYNPLITYRPGPIVWRLEVNGIIRNLQ